MRGKKRKTKNNYRPVSFISSEVKIPNKILGSQIKQHMAKQDLWNARMVQYDKTDQSIIPH